jgi:hypothetical protein
LYSPTVIIFAQAKAEHQAKQQTIKLTAANAQLEQLRSQDIARQAAEEREKEQAGKLMEEAQKNEAQVKRHLYIASFTHCFLYTRPGTAHCQARSRCIKLRRTAFTAGNPSYQRSQNLIPR